MNHNTHVDYIIVMKCLNFANLKVLHVQLYTYIYIYYFIVTVT